MTDYETALQTLQAPFPVDDHEIRYGRSSKLYGKPSAVFYVYINKLKLFQLARELDPLASDTLVRYDVIRNQYNAADVVSATVAVTWHNVTRNGTGVMSGNTFTPKDRNGELLRDEHHVVIKLPYPLTDRELKGAYTSAKRAAYGEFGAGDYLEEHNLGMIELERGDKEPWDLKKEAWGQFVKLYHQAFKQSSSKPARVPDSRPRKSNKPTRATWNKDEFPTLGRVWDFKPDELTIPMSEIPLNMIERIFSPMSKDLGVHGDEFMREAAGISKITEFDGTLETFLNDALVYAKEKRNATD